jgi:hypothetical protein
MLRDAGKRTIDLPVSGYPMGIGLAGLGGWKWLILVG